MIKATKKKSSLNIKRDQTTTLAFKKKEERLEQEKKAPQPMNSLK
jgi:hypothetical protein